MLHEYERLVLLDLLEHHRVSQSIKYNESEKKTELNEAFFNCIFIVLYGKNVNKLAKRTQFLHSYKFLFFL